MKTRRGFVSNSSSSSFVLKDDRDKGIAENFHIKSHLVTDVISIYSEINKRMNETAKIVRLLPEFLADIDDFYYNTDRDIDEVRERLEGLRELEEKHPGCRITEPYDRDCAFTNGFAFDLYQGDL